MKDDWEELGDILGIHAQHIAQCPLLVQENTMHGIEVTWMKKVLPSSLQAGKIFLDPTV